MLSYTTSMYPSTPILSVSTEPLPYQATLAAANVAAVLSGLPVWPRPDNVLSFVDGPLQSLPAAAPSIVNAKELKLPVMAA
jgi:hypothetical protein